MESTIDLPEMPDDWMPEFRATRDRKGLSEIRSATWTTPRGLEIGLGYMILSPNAPGAAEKRAAGDRNLRAAVWRAGCIADWRHDHPGE